MWWHVRWYTRYSVSKLLAGLWKTDVWLVFRFVFAGTAIWFGYLHHTITFVTSLPSELFLKTESYRILFCLFLLCAYYSAWYTCRNHPAGKSWVTTLPGLITVLHISLHLRLSNFFFNGDRCWGPNFMTALLLVNRMFWAIFFSAHCIVKMMINQYIFFPRIPKKFWNAGISYLSKLLWNYGPKNSFKKFSQNTLTKCRFRRDRWKEFFQAPFEWTLLRK